MNAYVALQRTSPRTANFITGAAVMAVGDAAVQLGVEAVDLDARRTAVCSGFNALVSVPLGTWYAHLDRVWPGKGLAAMARKVVVNQMFSSSLLPTGFLVWTNAVEALIEGKGGAAACEQAAEGLRLNGASSVLQSLLVWTPANTISFLFVPQHLRVAFMSCIALGWGGYLSFIAHRRIPHAARGHAASVTPATCQQ